MQNIQSPEILATDLVVGQDYKIEWLALLGPQYSGKAIGRHFVELIPGNHNASGVVFQNITQYPPDNRPSGFSNPGSPPHALNTRNFRFSALRYVPPELKKM